MHLDLDDAVPLARFASSPFDVERIAPRLVTPHSRFGELRKKIADEGEDAGIGRGIRSRRPSDRRLIDMNHFVDLIDSVDRLAGAGPLHASVEPLGKIFVEDFKDQG